MTDRGQHIPLESVSIHQEGNVVHAGGGRMNIPRPVTTIDGSHCCGSTDSFSTSYQCECVPGSIQSTMCADRFQLSNVKVCFLVRFLDRLPQGNAEILTSQASSQE